MLFPSRRSMSEANANRVKSRVSVLIFMINSWSIYGHLCSQKQPAFQVSTFFFFDMNFREMKFLDEPSASNRWPQGKARGQRQFS